MRTEFTYNINLWLVSLHHHVTTQSRSWTSYCAIIFPSNFDDRWPSPKCHTSPPPNPWGRGGERRLNSESYIAVRWRNLVIYAFLQKFRFLRKLAAKSHGTVNSSMHIVDMHCSLFWVRSFNFSSLKWGIDRLNTTHRLLSFTSMQYTENFTLWQSKS